MEQNYTQWLIGAVVVVVLAIGGYFFWKQSTPVVSPLMTATSTTSTSTVSLTTTGSSTPDYTTTLIPLPTTAGTSASTQAQLAALIDLGTADKGKDDYAGAEAAWIQATQIAPNNYVAFANLGDLYMNFLHDYAKADANYQAAIKDAATQPALYGDLFTLYTTTSYKPTATAAEDILKKGIAANPNAVELQVSLARYYKTLGRTADAKAEYDAAITNAKSQGETSLAAQLQTEENQ